MSFFFEGGGDEARRYAVNAGVFRVQNAECDKFSEAKSDLIYREELQASKLRGNG